MELTPSRVEAFYAFITERENIRLRRLLGWPREEWTLDPIFQKYSFTNVKRCHDRTTVELKKIYDEEFGRHMVKTYGARWWEDDNSYDSFELQRLLLNCTLFRYFGTVETALTIGWSADWDTDRKQAILDYGLEDDIKFTSAYIIPACGRNEPKYEIVCDIVDGIWKRSEDIVCGPNSWERQVGVLASCYGCGSFMAKEIMLDYVLAMEIEPDDWETWTPVGPGGCRGAGRVLLGYKEKIQERQALEVIRALYDVRKEYWRDDFVALDLTDIQFQLCEFDKYSRVAEGRAPKRRFKPTIDKITRQA